MEQILFDTYYSEYMDVRNIYIFVKVVLLLKFVKVVFAVPEHREAKSSQSWNSFHAHKSLATS